MEGIGYHVCEGASPPRADALRLALSDLGVETGDAPPHDAPVVLLFETVDAGVHEAVRERGSGFARVVAVHLGDAAPTAAQCWGLLDAGAADVVDGAAPAAAAAAITARLRRWQQVDALVDSPLVRQNLAGSSPAWRRVLQQVVEAAAFGDASVLLAGESGTGKELTARLIHTLDARRSQRPLVVLDCTTVMPELSGSEFFGHERGAFTGAAAPREGAFALADGGTLFLDEVGELPAALQAQLLRVVQERSYKRLGSTQWQRSEFRLVCATNRSLDDEVSRGAFRADLYYRIATCVFRLPPLRERPEDIIPLALRFLAEAKGSAEGSAETPALTPPVRDYLLGRRFPGNVRELRQLMLRIASRHVGDGPITVGDIPPQERPTEDTPPPDWRGDDLDGAIRRALNLGVGLRDISAGAADAAIRIALGTECGNLQRAARRLGVTDRALQLRRATAR